MRLWKCALLAMTVCAASASETASQQLSADQLKTFFDAARILCETVKEARGQRTGSELQADVQAKARGFCKFLDVGGGAKGTIDRETFEGLSREATASLLEGDRDCRERIANKLL